MNKLKVNLDGDFLAGPGRMFSILNANVREGIHSKDLFDQHLQKRN